MRIVYYTFLGLLLFIKMVMAVEPDRIVTVGESVQLSATASDQDCHYITGLRPRLETDSAIAITWTAVLRNTSTSVGSFPNGNTGSFVKWLAPTNTCDVTIRATASNAASTKAIDGNATDDIWIKVVDMEITGVSVDTSIGCVQDGLRMCFNGVDIWAQNPDTVGELVFTATGTTGSSTLDASLEWEFPAISGTVITSVPNPPVGPTVVFSLTGLPMNNCGFGKKILILKHPNIANYAEKEIELYYKANAWNWLGIQPVPHPYNPNYIHICLNERNYFHYYKETPAYVTGINWSYDDSSCNPLGGPPYTPYVGGRLLIGGPPEYTDVRSGISVANSGDVLRGVNLFAWACRHEYKHHIDYNNWWPIMWILDYDQEEDYLRDAMEYLFHISEGGPYYTNNPYTHPLDVIGGKDDQAECLFTQSTWQDAESGKSYDWAYPGSQWH